MSARLVEARGFPRLHDGYGASASRLGLRRTSASPGWPRWRIARNLAAAVTIPLIADADTGYGNALSVRRTVQAYEAAGVAALHIEDQVAPKRCGHLSGHQIVPRAEFAGKIRAAVDARTDGDLLVIARTDAISAESFDEALRRGEAAAAAGADMLFIGAAGQAEVGRAGLRRPAPLQLRAGADAAAAVFPRLRELGFAIVILPVDTLFVAVKAWGVPRRAEGRRRRFTALIATCRFRDFNELIGRPAARAVDRYSGSA